MISPVENIKSRLSIADVVSSYVKLEKAGANLKGRCPFHNEKSPSFFVSPGRNSYHCFGCNRGGDVFTFVQEIEGLSFPEALKLLADRAGVQLSSYSPKEAEESNRLHALLEAATVFYAENLKQYPKVTEYLMGRGLTEQTIADFRIGYAVPDWRMLFFHLRKTGYSEEDIEKSGLSIKSPKGYFDRFRGRIMFPIADTQGRVLGFSGRVFDNADDPKNAKYVNSPETVLYKKSKILFGYDRAKRAIAERDQCILVEGQFDLIMAHQIGSQNTVAVSGTALTEEQLGLIKRFTDNLVLAFDADAAGLKAALRGVGLALHMGFDVKMIRLPENQDPADYIRDVTHKNAADEWHKTVAGAQHIVLYLLDAIIGKRDDERTLRQNIQKQIVPFIAQIKNRLDQSYFIKTVAARTGIDENDMRDVVAEAARGMAHGDRHEAMPAGTRAGMADGPARPDSRDNALRKLAGLLFWKEEDAAFRGIVAAARERLAAIFAQDPGSEQPPAVPESYESEKDALVFETEMHYQGHERVSDEIEELLTNVEKAQLEQSLQAAMRELRFAEQGTDEGKVSALLKKCQDLSARIHELKKK